MKKQKKPIKKYGFRLRFSKPFTFIFSNKYDGYKAIAQIKEGLRQAGLTAADFNINEAPGIRKGRGLRVLKGGKRA